jgi:hypothetical protein
MSWRYALVPEVPPASVTDAVDVERAFADERTVVSEICVAG